jgi:predicted phosphodiesterase
MKIAWITDPHLDNIPVRNIEAYFLRQKQNGASGFILTGDIGEIQNFDTIIKHIHEITKTDIWFVLGNHDVWGGSFAEAQRRAESLTKQSSGSCIYLSSHQPTVLIGNSILIGHDGFYDGRAGTDLTQTNASLNDVDYIEDMKFPTRFQLAEFLSRKGMESADIIEERLALIAKRKPHISNWVLATHVPPFAEAARFNGRKTELSLAPFFVNVQLGNRLAYLMSEKYPEKNLTVLCGHTHHEFECKFGSNLTVKVGPAMYGEIYTTLIDL